jgi:hypothetical protein
MVSSQRDLHPLVPPSPIFAALLRRGFTTFLLPFGHVISPLVASLDALLSAFAATIGSVLAAVLTPLHFVCRYDDRASRHAGRTRDDDDRSCPNRYPPRR